MSFSSHVYSDRTVSLTDFSLEQLSVCSNSELELTIMDRR